MPSKKTATQQLNGFLADVKRINKRFKEQKSSLKSLIQQLYREAGAPTLIGKMGPLQGRIDSLLKRDKRLNKYRSALTKLVSCWGTDEEYDTRTKFGSESWTLRQLRDREAAAKSALKFLKSSRRGGMNGGKRKTGIFGPKRILSTNNPFDRAFYFNNKYKNKLDSSREYGANNIIDCAHAAIETGVGNCDEKARILATGLMSNPRLTDFNRPGYSYVTVMSSVNYDHVWVAVTDEPIPGGELSLRDLGPTAMIVDGWTEDYYFPNLTPELKSLVPGNGTPNPRQALVRNKVRDHKFQAWIYNDGNRLALGSARKPPRQHAPSVHSNRQSISSRFSRRGSAVSRRESLSSVHAEMSQAEAQTRVLQLQYLPPAPSMADLFV